MIRYKADFIISSIALIIGIVALFFDDKVGAYSLFIISTIGQSRREIKMHIDEKCKAEEL